jgi:diadenosine tetraphosphate (Ap4A) HIT family hydrolase
MDCHFCQILKDRGGEHPEDHILAESQSFYAKPGLGHFVNGYTLVNSKQHVTSFSFLPVDQLAELEVFSVEIARRLELVYGAQPLGFEHGEVGGRFHPGCCFEHAHLHLLPLPDRIGDSLSLDFIATRLGSLGELRSFSCRSIPYLLLRRRNGEVVVFNVDRNLPSQFLRREFCSRLGKQHQWDWAVFPFREEILKFTKLYHESAERLGWTYFVPT